MKIGVVVHGPNIIDSGYALKLIKFLENYGEVEAILGGTMGRTAVIDNSLENIIDISYKRFPSDSLKLFNTKEVDFIFLLNYGKSDVTGQVFGYKVYNHYLNKIKNNNIPVFQIERPGENDGTVISWNNLSMDLLNEIANKLNLKTTSPDIIYQKHFKEDDFSKSMRTIHGVSPGENIMVNGVVVGKSTSSKVTLVVEDGILIDIIGGNLKNHGVSKLGKINLTSCIVKTGFLRNAKVTPRILNKKKSNKIAFINHAGEDVYSFINADYVVTVGDDTTLVASDILYRFNIPIIGITDGDLDKVVKYGFKLDESVIFQVEDGLDDIIGLEIFKKIFKGETYLEISKNKILDEITKILNDFNCNYKTN